MRTEKKLPPSLAFLQVHSLVALCLTETVAHY